MEKEINRKRKKKKFVVQNNVPLNYFKNVGVKLHGISFQCTKTSLTPQRHINRPKIYSILYIYYIYIKSRNS